MGKHWRKKNKDKFHQKPKRERPQDNYIVVTRENASFEKYYKAQNIVPENEWEQFMSCIKRDLPAAFRLTGTKPHAQALLNIIHEKFFNPLIKENNHNSSNDEMEQIIFKANPLPWYPNNFGWQVNLTRKDIRSKESFAKLHQFLISETETGNISRQEAVSMIPPLLLDVQSHHKVLDMCAAPGSKTTQIMEYLHNNNSNSQVEGIVIANDASNKRCYMLTHQAKRLQSEALLVTNHDAAFMPNIMCTRKDDSVGPMKFDRILCDVPCCGDGTMRKNFDIWHKWNSINGANLHGLQLRIARRGLEMLAVGGRMVYSTCSFNPLQNESVINRLLAEYGDSISLVELKDKLPGLKYMPGLTDWVLMNKELEVIEGPDKIPPKNLNLFHKHLFPPTEEEGRARHLNRCIRILPHHQDTGAFFVAVLEKNKPLPGEKVYETEMETINSEETTNGRTQRVKSPPRKKTRGCFKEEPFYFFEESNIFWPEIKKFFEIKDSFDMRLLLRRAEEGKGRTIYYTNALVKDVINNNQDRMKIINGGLKVLARADNIGAGCNFRLAQDGLNMLLPFFSGRRMSVKKSDLLLMLTSEDDFPPLISAMDPATQKICETMDSGSLVYIYEEKCAEGFTIELVGWKGKHSMRCYLCKNDRIHYIRLLGGDTSNYEKNKFTADKIKPPEVECIVIKEE